MKKRILVIDDEPDFTNILKLGLEMAGYYNVREENDASRAIEAAREFEPDLVILDIMMPHIDGSDVAARIKSDHRLRDTPVLFLTALVMGNEAPTGAWDSGGHTFLPKGTPLPQLITSIEQKIGDKGTAPALAGAK